MLDYKCLLTFVFFIWKRMILSVFLLFCIVNMDKCKIQKCCNIKENILSCDNVCEFDHNSTTLYSFYP